MNDVQDISVTSVEFSQYIAKPPNYKGHADEDEDNYFVPIASRSRHHGSMMNGENEYDTAKQDESDGGGEERMALNSKARATSAQNVENNVFRQDGEDDLTGKELPGDNVKSVGSKNLSSGQSKRVGGARRKEEKTLVNDVDHGGSGGDNGREESWEILSKDGKKQDKIKVEASSPEDVTELVDEVEGALEAVSKGDQGAFGRLATFLGFLLPVVLVMADELKTLRDKVKDLLVHNRVLLREARQARQENEKRNQTETISVAVYANIQDEVTKQKDPDPPVCDRCKGGMSDGNKDHVTPAFCAHSSSDEEEILKKECKKQRHQIKELQRVNHSWERYTQKAAVKHEIEMKKKEAQAAAADERRKEIEQRLDEKFKDYDQTLIHAKKTEDQQRAAAAQYKKDRDALRVKYHEVEEKLKELTQDGEEKDAEIKRLNEVVERTTAALEEDKLPNGDGEHEARDIEPHYKVPVRHYHGAAREGEVKKPRSAYAYRVIYVDKHGDKWGKQTRGKSVSPPLSPRGPPVDDVGKEPPMSMTKDQLKDQVLMFREQIDVYRSDFNQERRDREKAMGQVEVLKKELDKTKIKLKDMNHQRKQNEHDHERIPEDTHEMRLTDLRKQALGGLRYPGHGRQYVNGHYVDLPEEHLYAEFD